MAEIIALCVALALAVLGVVWLRRRKPAPAPAPRPLPKTGPNSILVDGSNVMHWGGAPSLDVLSRVVSDLHARGYAPFVYFDANVGYKILGQHLHAEDLALAIAVPARDICIVPGGTVADECLLDHASRTRLRIVTNDRFRDWRQRFPVLDDKGLLVRGEWRDGAVVWRYPKSLGHAAAARSSA